MGRTPRIIHQTWKTAHVPPALYPLVETCRRLHPQYEYHLWTDEDLRMLVHRYYPQYAAHFDGFVAGIERADFGRYCILHHVGGVYADLDVEFRQSVESLVNQHLVILGDEPIEHRQNHYAGLQHVLCNALMISPPGEPVWLAVMQNIVDHYDPHSNPVANTGPMAVTRTYYQNPAAFEGVQIVSPCVFYPQTDCMTKKTQNDPLTGLAVPYISRECNVADAVAIHRWAHTWMPNSNNRRHSVRVWLGLLLILALTSVGLVVDRLAKRF